ncbi:TSUP family transporter [Amycolatopsis azurea]|uniref:TSUP family transporter n=1 Tax=Amycolatopsis azurea TaxID=36819 RepID=UPI003808080D
MTLLDIEDPPAPTKPVRSVLRAQLTVVAIVWAGWLLLGGAQAFDAMRRQWAVAVTMIFGSLVGGGTSEGGGAVAFPVFTKILQIPASDARVFTYAVQSVGMTAASLCVLWLRVPVERRVLRLGIPAGVAGVLLGTTVLAPLLSLAQIRTYFTVLLTSLALALVVMQRRGGGARNASVPLRGRLETGVIIGAGFAGGVVSGLVGVGENTVMFIVLVLLFRVSEKVATPTTVILMTAVSIAAFGSHVFLVRDFSGAVVEYWLAAVPVVVVGAPVGAMICSRMSRTAIRHVLLGLIAVEFVSTLVLVRMDTATRIAAAAALVAVTFGCCLLTSVRRYTPVGAKQLTGDTAGVDSSRAARGQRRSEPWP